MNPNHSPLQNKAMWKPISCAWCSQSKYSSISPPHKYNFLRIPSDAFERHKLLSFIAYHRFSWKNKITFGSNKLSQGQCVVLRETTIPFLLLLWELLTRHTSSHRTCTKATCSTETLQTSTGHSSRGQSAPQEIQTTRDNNFYYLWIFMSKIT